MYMLWFNFILGSNFISLCLKLTIIHYITQKQKNIKFEPRIKLNHNIYIYRPKKPGKWTIRLRSWVTVFLIPSFRLSTVSSGNVRKIKKFFIFLNDAEDLRKRGIKKRDTIAQGQLYIYAEMLKSVEHNRMCSRKMSLKNMEFITEYIYFHQTYINIQCVVQRANIATVKTKFTKIHYHS